MILVGCTGVHLRMQDVTFPYLTSCIRLVKKMVMEGDRERWESSEESISGMIVLNTEQNSCIRPRPVEVFHIVMLSHVDLNVSKLPCRQTVGGLPSSLPLCSLLV